MILSLITYKKELNNQNKFDIVFISSGIILQLIVGILTNSTLISFISGISGIFAVVLCAQRKLVQFPFSFLQLFTYVILAYEQHFYGELWENAFYFITMIFGIFVWNSGYNKCKNIISVKKLSKVDNIIVFLLNIVLIYVLYVILKGTNDTQPLLDAISTIPAFTAQFLMMTRYKENWYYWLIIDLASIVMWAIAGNWIMVAQFIFWSINCIYGIYKWRNN